MDVLYHINRKEDEEGTSKINIDELYEKKQQHDMFTLGSYNKILTRIHNKIRYTSKQYIDNNFCWYLIPEVLLGIPKYDHRDCTAYVIDKLQENDFIVRYIHPNLLFISWNHWVPSYVRSEIKKKTGVVIDGRGNRIDIDKDDINNQSNGILKNENDNIVFNLSTKNINSGLNKNNNISTTGRGIQANSTQSQYRDINTYRPEGKLIYNDDLLKKLSINDL
jgi:hypothetical protein